MIVLIILQSIGICLFLLKIFQIIKEELAINRIIKDAKNNNHSNVYSNGTASGTNCIVSGLNNKANGDATPETERYIANANFNQANTYIIGCDPANEDISKCRVFITKNGKLI